jgi:hypothetical protein
VSDCRWGCLQCWPVYNQLTIHIQSFRVIHKSISCHCHCRCHCPCHYRCHYRCHSRTEQQQRRSSNVGARCAPHIPFGAISSTQSVDRPLALHMRCHGYDKAKIQITLCWAVVIRASQLSSVHILSHLTSILITRLELTGSSINPSRPRYSQR